MNRVSRRDASKGLAPDAVAGWGLPRCWAVWAVVVLLAADAPLLGQERSAPKGVRPYELEWAGRKADTRPPLVDFENLDGWTVESAGGQAALTLSKEQPLWGEYAAKLAYRGSAQSQGASFVLRPPRPIQLPATFDSVTFWVWGDYWKWREDKGKPVARMSVLLATPGGQSVEVLFPRGLDWPDWWLMHVRLSAAQRAAVAAGATLTGIRLSNCRLDDERTIYLNNLAVYTEPSLPVPCAVQPQPGVDLAPGQDLGVQTGPERLPFPTRAETLLPDNLVSTFKTELLRDESGYVFRYRGSDGALEYLYRPESGTLGDISAIWQGAAGSTLHPLAEGGVRLAVDRNVEGLLNTGGVYLPRTPKAVAPDKIVPVECRQEGNTVIARWRVTRDGQSAEVTYTLRLWQKSLVVDVHCGGGEVGEVSLGGVAGADHPRLVTVPFWTGEDLGEDRGRPALLVMGPAKQSLFCSVFLDHTRTGASQFFFQSGIEKGLAVCSGGSRYLPRTDGRRNACFERIFLTLSPRLEETLPRVPNPPSPWRRTAAEYLVCAHGAQDRASDYAHWQKLSRYGIRKVVVLDHETGWRDHAESFTFRTVPAPGKGGDEGQRAYARRMQELGFRYGLYNNYTDLVPLNAHWDEDLVSRTPAGEWQTAWFRCYAPKPARIAAIERTLTPLIQEKFHLDAGLLDVHTAITPWRRVDYDARIPGAGTLLSQFYAYGQLMLHQQQVWNGPVFSEGGNHWYFAGLITGSFAQDRGYDLAGDPWLVDFDLRQLHPLGCDIGFKSPGAFSDVSGRTGAENSPDRFFAGTIAFGHVGHFANSGHVNARFLRSYYMLQQLQAAYAGASVREIRYANDQGALLATSAAVATDAYRRSQIRLEYDNGLVVWVNGHTNDTWKTPYADLPPNGYYARNLDSSLVVSSALADGRRADSVHSPAYDYVDGRGRWLQTPWAASDGQLIVLKEANGSREVIPFQAKRFAVATAAAPSRVVALDENGADLGSAQAELRDGLLHIQPFPGAISYRLSQTQTQVISRGLPERVDRFNEPRVGSAKNGLAGTAVRRILILPTARAVVVVGEMK